ncbi:hypothetical protein KOW79_019100 [Hemibagrus wyckioides]|uniref:Uncharacterized protein n=1 Tax=Hemibagrus wyckioides TaxID=337641 RepID=A0A9D3SC03_9TELE|nr:hypothetical protein KOW79_019100 [Hemibagrus wyckioides]
MPCKRCDDTAVAGQLFALRSTDLGLGPGRSSETLSINQMMVLDCQCRRLNRCSSRAQCVPFLWHHGARKMRKMRQMRFPSWSLFHSLPVELQCDLCADDGVKGSEEETEAVQPQSSVRPFFSDYGTYEPWHSNSGSRLTKNTDLINHPLNTHFIKSIK